MSFKHLMCLTLWESLVAAIIHRSSTIKLIGTTYVNCCALFQAAHGKLTEDERASLLSPLQENGWTLVDGRDAIYKEFVFKNFNEVPRCKAFL